MKEDLVDGRCAWCAADSVYRDYHDNEWGRLVTDDISLFELVTLEGAQAGLTWLSILRRREGYRKAFLGFDPHKVAAMTDDDVERLMQFDGIIRNRLKIKSTTTNAAVSCPLSTPTAAFTTISFHSFPTESRLSIISKNYPNCPPRLHSPTP